MIRSWLFSMLNIFSNLLFAITSSQIDGYANFNATTDTTFTFDGAAGKVQLYTSDDSVKVEFNEATNVNSMVLPKSTVVERSGVIKTVYVKGVTTTGTLHISGDPLSELKSDLEIQDTLNTRKI